MRDEHSILPVSTLAKGHYGLNDLYISVPSLVGARGVEDILDVNLSDEERAALEKSAAALKAVIAQINA